MVTITKAVVRRLNTEKDNHFLVYIPLLQKANDKEVNATMEATLVSIRGIDKTIKVGDVVYVSFEDDKLSKPVILGKLYLGETYEKDSGITIVSDSLTVNKSTILNNTATISGINLDNINNGLKKLIEQNYIDSDNIQYDNAKVLSRSESGDIIPLSSSILQDALDDVAIRLSNIENTPSISSIDGLGGGTLISPLIITGGDSATASKIILNQNDKGQITDSATSTLFGFLNSNTLTVGGNSYALNLRGNETRPTYKGNELSLISDIPTNQATSTVIRDALTNINGRVLSNYEATYYTASQSTAGYAYYHITKNNNNLTEEEAKNYMEYMTGSRFLPTFNYEKPVNSIFIMADGSFWKPQYTQNSGLDLYKIPSPYITDVKTINEQSIVGSGNVNVGKTTLYKHTVQLGIGQLVFYNNISTPFDFNNPSAFFIPFLRAIYGVSFFVFSISINLTTKIVSILYLDASNTFKTDTIDGTTLTDVVTVY